MSSFAVVRGPDRTFYEIKLVRGLMERAIRRVGLGSGNGGFVLVLGMAALGWVRWIREGRRWRVRVVRYPTLQGDDQMPRVVAESEELSRGAALARADAMRISIPRGDPSLAADRISPHAAS